ncbi:hypothetical protein PENTCL1PPCAC_11685 [Pristionchus entomophagus]|uniref:SET domain-containing protein n=1 Tax=Pristionchus entomophagus TaxID=358040 RepID=A0AAV5T210_9BILA|nr:hypothetical protein PENTCL1PPCAC_11685 [Pristionchus entomophagus]
MDRELHESLDSLSMDELPDIEQDALGRLLISADSVGRKCRKDTFAPVIRGEGAGEAVEWEVEAVEAVEWDERRLMFDVKWKNYSRDHNTKEGLASFLSLQIPYKFFAEENPTNEESECFKIFAGLHKVGYRCHYSEDRWFFCVMKERLLKADHCEAYLRTFKSMMERDELLREYNTRLQVEGHIQFKVMNEVDMAMPPPFFGIDLLNKENEAADHLPSLTQKKEITIVRNQGTWSLRTDSVLADGTDLFSFGGYPCDSSLATKYMEEMGELLAFSHFVYIGKEEGMEWSLDRRGVFDAASCLSHSCDPNCKIVWTVSSRSVRAVTRRIIQKGEELSIDYFSINKTMRMKSELLDRLDMERDCVECTCLSPDCRIILYSEIQLDPCFYEYNKEDKLSTQSNSPYKGVWFNMQ